jgi:hypothetical protein
MCDNALSARTIGRVSGRFRLRTSETRPRLPIAGSRSRRVSPYLFHHEFDRRNRIGRRDRMMLVPREIPPIRMRG